MYTRLNKYASFIALILSLSPRIAYGAENFLLPPHCPRTVISIEDNDFINKFENCSALGQSILDRDFGAFQNYIQSKQFKRELDAGHYQDLIFTLVRYKQTAMLKLALNNKDIPINIADESSGFTPLYQAWHDGYDKGYELLSKHGASHNSLVIWLSKHLFVDRASYFLTKTMLVAGGIIFARVTYNAIYKAGYSAGHRAGFEVGFVAGTAVEYGRLVVEQAAAQGQ